MHSCPAPTGPVRVPLRGPCGFMPYSAPTPPNLVKGLLECEELACLLESLMQPSAFKSFHGEGTAWYEDDGIVLRGFDPTMVLIKDLRWCNPNQVKLVLAHLPDAGVLVVTQDDPELAWVQRQLMKLALCCPRYMRVCWLRGHEQLAGVYPLAPDDRPEIVFETMKKTLV